MAALWPPMPLTPPPRRAPAPHSSTRGCAVSTPQRPASPGSSANGQDRSPWKMWPPGMPSSASRSTGVLTSMHGWPSRSRSRHSCTGSPRTVLIDRKVAASASRRASSGRSRNRRAGMCSPNTVSVCAPLAASSAPRIDGSVSEWQ